MQAKQLKKPAIVLALVTALGAGFAASPVLAANPRGAVGNVKMMDANHDQKVSKKEILAFMGAQFDKAAGAKGYCTYKEIADVVDKEWYEKQ